MLKALGIIVLVVTIGAVLMLVFAAWLVCRVEQKGHDGL